MDKKQTAVQEFNWWVNWELESLLDGTLGYDEFKKQLEAKFLEAIAIEKEQIIDAYRNGRTDQQTRVPKFYNRSSAIYYTSTYGQ
jgi:hypothetical protein